MPWFNAPGQLTGGAWSPGDGRSWAYPQPFVRHPADGGMAGAVGGGLGLGQIAGGMGGVMGRLFGGSHPGSWLPGVLNGSHQFMTPEQMQQIGQHAGGIAGHAFNGAPMPPMPPRESVPPGEGWQRYGAPPPGTPPVSMPQPTGPREAPEAHPGMADRAAGQWAAGGWSPQPQPYGTPQPLVGGGGNISATMPGNWQGGASTPPLPTRTPMRATTQPLGQWSAGLMNLGR